jgi:hypothetical protein
VIVSPGNASLTAAEMVLNGNAAEPLFASFPLTETWYTLPGIEKLEGSSLSTDSIDCE